MTPATATAGAALALPPDQAERERIVRDLERNLLVEAGAGSGKTRQLVERILALVRAGRPLVRVAAVTFTRKAAAELGQRLRIALETARAQAPASLERDRLDAALHDVHLAFVGTIHAFCARILRENPLQAGVDPGFDELGEAETKRLAQEYWHWHLEARHAAEDPVLQRLADVGVDPSVLQEAFVQRLDDSDVEYPRAAEAEPDVSAARDRLLELMAEADERLRSKPTGTSPDPLQRTLRRLRWHRRSGDWSRPRDFLAAVERLSKTGCGVTQKCWADDAEGKAAAKELGRAMDDFRQRLAEPLLERWYAHRYEVVLDFLEPLLRDFAAHRRRSGKLTFQDLLQLAVDLLRSHPEVRRRAGRRWRHLLVDEFQDTDPLQAELCLLLASEPEEGDDWLRVEPRPGALFVVGDPKQSIYRFRRADLAVYDQVARRFEAFGAIVRLTANFRSGGVLGRFVDEAFRPLLPERSSPEQAAFAETSTLPERAGQGRVLRYVVPGRPKEAALRVAETDAGLVATWIAGEVDAGRRAAGDFLILPYRKYAVAVFARELERRGVPVTTSGAGLTVERELRELIVLLHALDDPQDEIWTVAALEGLFFGIDPRALWEHRAAGGRFSYERPHPDPGSPVDSALATLRRWSRLCRDVPVDGALETIVEEIGLLPLAAAGEMAETRAGSLVHALEAVAAGALRGAADLRSAIQAIEDAAESPEVEAPLRPGRIDAVRVMNLHKAKGLQGRVVVLPHPAASGEEPPIVKHVRRGDVGPPQGYLRIQSGYGKGARPIAQPADWEVWEARERKLEAAQWRRLLYVAATRAEEELLVAERPEAPDDSPWRELRPALATLAAPLVLRMEEPPPLPGPEVDLARVRDWVAAVEDARRAASRPAYVATTPSAAEGAEGDEEEEGAFRGAEGRGRAWGDVVHRAIAAMGRGRAGDELRLYAAALLRGAGRPLDAEGRPAELQELMEVLETVRGSGAWADLAGPGSRWELTVARFRGDAAPAELVTGSVDALRLPAHGEPLRLVDWKTDAVGEDDWAARARRYGKQIRAYREVLGELTGTTVEGRLERVGRRSPEPTTLHEGEGASRVRG